MNEIRGGRGKEMRKRKENENEGKKVRGESGIQKGREAGCENPHAHRNCHEEREGKRREELNSGIGRFFKILYRVGISRSLVLPILDDFSVIISHPRTGTFLSTPPPSLATGRKKKRKERRG